jgi:hypothetical protein
MCDQTRNNWQNDSRLDPNRASIEARLSLGKILTITFSCLLAMFLAVGCATTKVTEREQVVTGELPRPETIWVYNFSATPADLPIKTSLDREYFSKNESQTPEQIAEGRKLGVEIEKELIYQIGEMGMHAEHAVAGTNPAVNDIVIQGYLLSYNEGNEEKRVAIGLGSGASDLKVAVEGLQMTPDGLRLLGSGSTDAEGNKTPGGAVGLATLIATHNPAGLIISTGLKIYDEKSGSGKVEGRAKQTAKEIADQMKKRFEEQGWIK